MPRAESCIATRNPHRCRTGFRSPGLGIAVKAARIVHRGREQCCRKQDINAPKEVIWKKTFWEKREVSLQNITSDRGIMLRMNRSIQVEGAFGLLKNDFSFRRFMTTGKRNIRIELFFLALGFNLKKRWMKQQKSRLETHYSEKKAS